MIHFTNKKTGEVFGYESKDEAKKYNSNYKDLLVMSDEKLAEYKKKPLGGKWSINGWAIDENEKSSAIVSANKAIINALTQEATLKIDILKYAISSGKELEVDKDKLIDWEDYRLSLSRIDTNIEEMDLPEKPN